MSSDEPLAFDLSAAMLATGVAIADRAVVCDIEGEGVRGGSLGVRSYDIRSMLDEREHPQEFIDIAREALAWAVARRLVVIDDAAQPHIVRIVAPLDL